MRPFRFSLAATAVLLVAPLTSPAIAQSTDGESRQAIVEQAQTEKATALRPYVPTTFERVVTRVQDTLLNQTIKWHPFFENAYSGGGFAPGVGYVQHVSAFSTID